MLYNIFHIVYKYRNFILISWIVFDIVLCLNFISIKIKKLVRVHASLERNSIRVSQPWPKPPASGTLICHFISTKKRRYRALIRTSLHLYTHTGADLRSNWTHTMSRKLSSHLRTLHLLRSTPKTNSFAAAAAATTSVSSSQSPAAFRSSVTFFPRHFSTVSGILSHFSLYSQP